MTEVNPNNPNGNQLPGVAPPRNIQTPIPGLLSGETEMEKLQKGIANPQSSPPAIEDKKTGPSPHGNQRKGLPNQEPASRDRFDKFGDLFDLLYRSPEYIIQKQKQ